jgi:hypothetical protein
MEPIAWLSERYRQHHLGKIDTLLHVKMRISFQNPYLISILTEGNGVIGV